MWMGWPEFFCLISTFLLLSLYAILTPFLGHIWLIPVMVLFLILAVLYGRDRVHIRVFRWFFIAFVAMLIVRSLLRIIFQYFLWHSSPSSAFLLPPHTSIRYFLGYSFTHHAAWLVLTFISVFLIMAVLYGFGRLKRMQGRRLWRDGEVFLFLSCMLLAGWPLVLPYMLAGLFLAVLLSAARTFLFHNPAPLSMSSVFLFLLPVFIVLKGAILSWLGLTSLVMPM